MKERAELHARVRAFVDRSGSGATPDESFDELGVAIARYQATHVAGFRRLLSSRGIDPAVVRRVRELPAVPTDAFKLTRVAAHPPEDDAAVFRTSGTTIGARGLHALSTTATYEAVALAWGRWGLVPDAPPELTAIVLAPPPDEAPDSSLGFMMDLFARTFASRASWIVRDGRIDLELLTRACEARPPALLMGPSFAFVHVLEALAGRSLRLPPGSRAMQTGGFKGRSREVDAGELRREIARTFGMPEACVASEYGMTELSSQLYDGTLRRHLGVPTPSARAGVFVPPPWLRVVAVDGEGLTPVSEGSVGILRFEDLANVDSALVVQTADLGRVSAVGVELLGRASGAPPRGCSIAADEILAGA